MTDIFSSTPGAVVALDGPGVTMAIDIEGWEGYAGFKSIVTGISVETENGTQFMHTLRDFVYVYTFGERIGRMKLTGLSFAAQCETNDAQYHGIEYVYAYYLEARASNLAGPLVVTIGGATSFFAFMTGMQFDFADAERTMASFSMSLNTVPVANQLVPEIN